MSSHLKTPFGASMNNWGAGIKADQTVQDGKSYPCVVQEVLNGGAFVKVAFNLVSENTLPTPVIPVLGSRYVRLPVQVGDQGMAIAASARLGSVTGQSGPTREGVPGNFSALVFAWLGNKNWDAMIDPGSVEISGPNGVILTHEGGGVRLTLTPGGVEIEGDVTIKGDLTVEGKATTDEFTIKDATLAVKLSNNSNATKMKAL